MTNVQALPVQHRSTALDTAEHTRSALSRITVQVERTEARLQKLGPGQYAFPNGAGNTALERNEIQASIATISGAFEERVGPDDLRTTFRALTSNLKAKDNADTGAIVDGYALALGNLCAPALIEAVARLIGGTAGPNYSRTFTPSTAELATLAREIEAEWMNRKARLERLLAMRELAPKTESPQLSPEEKAKLNEALARYRTCGAIRPLKIGPMGVPPRTKHGMSDVQAECERRRQARERGEGVPLPSSGPAQSEAPEMPAEPKE